MTSPDAVGTIPVWNRADRLRKSMHEAGLSVQAMAEYFEVSRNTISAWINNRIDPAPASIRLWALRCGVPYEWLKDGSVPPSTTPEGEPPVGFEPTTYRLEGQPSGKLFRFPAREPVAA